MLRKRNATSEELAKEIIEETEKPIQEKKPEFDYSKVVSTNSTLLDLAISGGKSNGGIPGGTITEIYGLPGSGKTAILAEMGASVQNKNGSVLFCDPEARLDQEYARIYGINLEHKDYHRPDTVEQFFSLIQNWKPENANVINMVAADSLAALSTEMEMEDQDKMGMKRAKMFSEGLRKSARLIANNNWIIACSNQLREGQYGKTTPGGKAIPYYASLRMEVTQVGKIEKEITHNGKKAKKVIGIESNCLITKSTIDSPYRNCKIFIVFNYGVDDIRGNLAYIKDTTCNTVYDCLDGKTYQSMEKAILYIESENLQAKLKDKTIEIWNEIEDKFKVSRKPKER